MHIRIGTRTSPLSIKQTEIFIHKLKNKTEFSYEIIPINTTGDKILNKPLYEIGGKGLFLKELEEALLNDIIDVAVHSYKDIPGSFDNRLIISSVLKREDPEDMLISNKYNSIFNLPENTIIGTCSPRRMAQIKKINSKLIVKTIRGNIQTRIKKFLNNEYDALILAKAGLKRMEIDKNDYCHLISKEIMTPAPCQGVIAIQIKSNNTKLKELTSLVNDEYTHNCCLVERGFLETLGASCNSPVAAYAEISKNIINASFMYSDFEHKRYKTKKISVKSNKFYETGKKIAQEMKENLIS